MKNKAQQVLLAIVAVIFTISSVAILFKGGGWVAAFPFLISMMLWCGVTELNNNNKN